MVQTFFASLPQLVRLHDQRMVHTIHLCDTYNVPLATNLASAEMLIIGLQRGDLDWRMMMKNKKILR